MNQQTAQGHAAPTQLHQIVVFPRGQLLAKDKERLTKLGIVAVEADNPADVRVLVPASSSLSASDLLLAAMDGLTSDYATSSTHSAMVQSLSRRLRKAAGEEQ